MNCNVLIIDAFWVDNKHFPTELPPNWGDGRAFYETYEGPARYLGWMDLVLLREIIKKNSINHIILQNLDTLGEIAELTHQVKVCTHYEINRFIVKALKKQTELQHCKPLYQTVVFGSWSLSKDDDKIPPHAQQYMKFLLAQTRVKSITCMTDKIKYTLSFDLFGNIVSCYEPNV